MTLVSYDFTSNGQQLYSKAKKKDGVDEEDPHEKDTKILTEEEYNAIANFQGRNFQFDEVEFAFPHAQDQIDPESSVEGVKIVHFNNYQKNNHNITHCGIAKSTIYVNPKYSLFCLENEIFSISGKRLQFFDRESEIAVHKVEHILFDRESETSVH